MQQKNAELAEKNEALKESFVTISKTNRQNELLLREVHHRVKNNLQMLISMFNLQKENLEDERMIAVFTQAQDRLQSIALVHQNIYQNNCNHNKPHPKYLFRKFFISKKIINCYKKYYYSYKA